MQLLTLASFICFHIIFLLEDLHSNNKSWKIYGLKYWQKYNRKVLKSLLQLNDVDLKLYFPLKDFNSTGELTCYLYRKQNQFLFTSFIFTFIISAADTVQAETEEGNSFVHSDSVIQLNLEKLANKEKESYKMKKVNVILKKKKS